MLPFYNPSRILLYMKELEEKTPVFLELHPSNFCNHRCIWCRYVRNTGMLPLEFMLDLLKKYPQVKGIRITGGGEPLINKYIIDFIERCGRMGIATSIETNGSLLDTRSINIIGNNCRYCRISLDAATAETHTRLHQAENDFYKILTNMKLLRETALPELGLSYLVTEDNVDEIILLGELNLPITYIHFKPLIQGIDDQTKEKTLRNIEELEKRANYAIKFNRIIQDDYANKEIACRIPTLIRVVGADGKEYVCCEHAYEEEFEVVKWDGLTAKCNSCRYNPYNEIIDMYKKNTLSKEFL